MSIVCKGDWSLGTACGDCERCRASIGKRVEELGTAYLYKRADGRTVLLDEKKLTVLRRAPRHVDVVFDGPPGQVAGRFVEVEDHTGKSVGVGTWLQRDDGYWVLRFEEVR